MRKNDPNPGDSAFGIGILTAFSAMLAPIVLGLGLFRERLPFGALYHQLVGLSLVVAPVAIFMAVFGFRRKILGRIYAAVAVIIQIVVWSAVIVLLR